MTRPDDRLSIVAFLRACSQNSLGEFLLSKRNRVAILEKDLRELIDRLGENTAYAELAELIRELLKQGQGAADLATSSQRVILPPNGWHWILDRRDLSHFEKSTMLAIRSSANGNNVADTSAPQLAYKLSLSTQSIERALKTLRERQFIQSKMTGKGLRIQLLEPPPLLFCGPSIRGTSAPDSEEEGPSNGGTRSLSQRDQVPLIEGSGPSNRGTLSVHQYTGTPLPSADGLPVRGVALAPAARATDPELRKLELQAEILGRTERLQKNSGSGNRERVAEGPTSQMSEERRMERAKEILARPHHVESAKREQESRLARAKAARK